MSGFNYTSKFDNVKGSKGTIVCLRRRKVRML